MDKIKVKHIEQLIIEKQNIDFENWIIYRNIFLFVSFIAVLNLEILYFLKKWNIFKFNESSDLFFIIVIGIIAILTFYIVLLISQCVLKSECTFKPFKLIKNIEKKLKINFRNNINDKFYMSLDKNERKNLIAELEEKRKKLLEKKTFSFSDILKTFFSIFTIPSFITVILILNNEKSSEQIKIFFFYYLLTVFFSFIIFIGIKLFLYSDTSEILKLDEIQEYLDERFNIEEKIKKDDLKELIESIDYEKVSKCLELKNEYFENKIVNYLKENNNPIKEINDFYNKDIKEKNLDYKKLEKYLDKNEIKKFVLEKLEKYKIECKFDFEKNTRLRVDDDTTYIIVQKKIKITSISKVEKILEEDIVYKVYNNKLEMVNDEKILKKIDIEIKGRNKISIAILLILILIIDLIFPIYYFNPQKNSTNFKEYIVRNLTGTGIKIKTNGEEIKIDKDSIKKLNLKKGEHKIEIIKQGNQSENYTLPTGTDSEVVIINFNNNSLPSYNILKYQSLNQIEYLKEHEYTLINFAEEKMDIAIRGNYYKLEANDAVKINLNDGKIELTDSCNLEIRHNSIGGLIILKKNKCEIKNY